MRRIGYVLLLVATIVTIAQAVYFVPKLPDQVANHFNAHGVADGWTSRNTFLISHVCVQLIMATLLVGVAEYSRFLPDAIFNMPNKEYWLHEDRRDQTLLYNGAILILIAGATAIFLAGIFQLIYMANLGAGDANPGGLDARDLPGHLFWPLLGGYFAIVFYLCGLALWKFGQVPSAE